MPEICIEGGGVCVRVHARVCAAEAVQDSGWALCLLTEKSCRIQNHPLQFIACSPNPVTSFMYQKESV